MTLYLYDKSSGRLVREIQNVLSYTDQSVTTAAAEYGPTAPGRSGRITAGTVPPRSAGWRTWKRWWRSCCLEVRRNDAGIDRAAAGGAPQSQ